MSVTSWIILLIVFSLASFFIAAALCAAGRDGVAANAYKRGLKDGMVQRDGPGTR